MKDYRSITRNDVVYPQTETGEVLHEKIMSAAGRQQRHGSLKI
jgi:hypothetical protein